MSFAELPELVRKKAVGMSRIFLPVFEIIVAIIRSGEALEKRVAELEKNQGAAKNE